MILCAQQEAEKSLSRNKTPLPLPCDRGNCHSMCSVRETPLNIAWNKWLQVGRNSGEGPRTGFVVGLTQSSPDTT